MNLTTIDHPVECCCLTRFERRDLKWFGIYFAFYMFMYASYIFAVGVHVEDLLDGKVDSEHLLHGRWMIWAVRQLTGGEAVNYPIAGIMAGIFLSATVLLLVKWLRIHDTISRAVCGMVYFSIPQWFGVLFYQKMVDAEALGILLCSLAAILICSPGKRYIALSIVCCTLGISCYQTLALVFGVVVVTALLYSQRHSISGIGFRYVLKAALVSLVSCAFYFCLTHIIKTYCDPDAVAAAARYENSVVGWGQCTDWRQTCHMLWTYGIRVPLLKFVWGKHNWLEVAAMMVFLMGAYKACGLRKTLLLALLGILLLALPYSTGFLLLSPTGMSARVMLAMPMAGLCCVALMLGERGMKAPALRKACLLLCAVLFVNNSYYISAIAKDHSYGIQSAVAELRDMNLMGRCAAMNTEAQDGRILLCGALPDAYYEDARIGAVRQSSWHSSCACPYLFKWQDYHIRKWFVASYTRAARLPRLVVASDEEVAAHAEILQSMPIWPADGSVKVDGDVVLIKIWD